MPQIADTGFLVAYWNKADIHHAWARSLAVRAPLLTCEPVITEAAYLIGNPEPLLQMLMDGDLNVEFDISRHARELLQWLEKFSYLQPGLADACIVILASHTPRGEILTADRRDFTIYRTLGGKLLRCSYPASME